MTEKRYVFIPEPTKYIKVYNANNNSLSNFTNFDETQPDVAFKYSIDEFDKIKLFYINGKNEPGSTDDVSYLNAKAKDSIKSLFGINELAEFNMDLDSENPSIVFTVFYDVNGIFCERYKLNEYNRYKTILAHTYTYNIYKRYNLS
jgi:hypothetical protein